MFLRLQHARVFAAVPVVLCVTFAGCALRGATPSRVTPDVATAAAAPATHLYVWNQGVPPAELDEYPVTGGRPALRISSPKGLEAGRTTIDGEGTLYIDGGPPYAPNVSEYKAGSAKPFKTIVKGVGSVIGLINDGKNDLYLLDAGGPLVKYAPGATTPAFATYAGLCTKPSSPGPQALTADGDGNAYVLAVCGRPGHAGGVVSQYDGSGKVMRTISFASAKLPYAMTVDAAGRLYVGFAYLSGGIRMGVAEYDRGSTKPVTSFYFGTLLKSGEVGASPPVVDDSTGTLYVTFSLCNGIGSTTSKCRSSIYQFARGATTASQTLRGPAGTTYDTPVLDAGGNLYVNASSSKSSVSTVQRFAKGASSSSTILSGHKIFLGFAWPTIGSSRTTVAGAQFDGVGGR